MKKILCILTAAALCCGIPFPRLHATATEGSCGEHAAWNYQDGTLTVTGTGAMTDYPDPARLKDSADQQRVPWYDCTAEIRSVVIGEGITHVGDYAFTRTAALETVTLPDSLISLGNNAFSCSALPEVTLPAHLETLGNSCFFRQASQNSVRSAFPIPG